MDNPEKNIEIFEVTINHRGTDITLTVDHSTANSLLNDPEFADKYIEAILNPSNNENSQENNPDENRILVWSSKGKPTNSDDEATLLLLELRSEFNEKFCDRKTNKQYLWKLIATEMFQSGFQVDTKRVQQKFANLQKSYLKFRDNMKYTGTDKKNPPPYYDEMHNILGSKDKTNPKGLIDSFKEGASEVDNPDDAPQTTSDTELEDMFESGPSISNTGKSTSNTEKIVNLFVTRRNEKPKNTNLLILEEVTNQLEKKENRNIDILEKLLERQNQQRERMLSLFEQMIENKKRKRDDSED